MRRNTFNQTNAPAFLLVALCAVMFISPLQIWAQNPDFISRAGEKRSSLTGHVVTADGRSTSDASVELRTMAGATIQNVRVDHSGFFHVADLDPGWYEVVASSGTARVMTSVSISTFPEQVTIRLGSAQSTPASHALVSVNSLAVPSKAKKEYEAADRLFQKNDMNGAWGKVNKALEVFPKYAAALTLRGVLKMASNQEEQAIEDFHAAMEADRSYQLAYVALASTYNGMSRFDEALQTLDQVNSDGRPFWQAHFEASKALLGKKIFDRALQEADLAAGLLGRDFPGINVVKANAYIGLQDMNSAAKELRSYLRRENSGPLADKVREILANLGQ